MKNKYVSFLIKYVVILVILSLAWVFFRRYLFNLLTLKILIPLIILSVPLFISRRWQIIPMIIWGFPLSLAVANLGMYLVSFLFINTSTYYMNIELEKHDETKICTSMVEITSRAMLRPGVFLYRPVGLIGEAVYCDLGSGDNLIATLSFPKDEKGNSIYSLPWIASGFDQRYRQNWPEFIEGQIELTGEHVPILVSFSDIEDQGTIERVEYTGAGNETEGEYVIKKIWVEMTNDEYKSYGIKDHLPWIDSMRGAARQTYRDVFSQAGVEYRPQLFFRTKQ